MRKNDWSSVRAACRSLVKDNMVEFFRVCKSKPICHIPDDFLGQMCSAKINVKEPEKMYRYLYDQYKIEIPVMRHGADVYLRYSINAFNNQEDLDLLFEAINQLVKDGWIA
jgi:isopenicillin-N epimerase